MNRNKALNWSLVLLLTARVALAADLAIPWFSIDAGGGISSGGRFVLNGTIGQPDAGKVSAGRFDLLGGFWGVAIDVPRDDSALHVTATVTSVSLIRTYAVNTDPDKNAFRLSVNYRLRRFDGGSPDNTADDVAITLRFKLIKAETGEGVRLRSDTANFSRAIRDYEFDGAGRKTTTELGGHWIQALQPEGILDSVHNTYRVEVTISHEEDPISHTIVEGNTLATPDRRLLHFNGTLLFGPVETRFTSIANDPAAGVVADEAIESTVAVDGNSGFIVSRPAYTFGDGTELPVRLRSNGDAEYSGALPVAVTGPSPEAGEIAHVRYERRGGITLNTAGASGRVVVTLPTGFGYSLVNPSRLLESELTFDPASLDQALAPIGTLSFNGGGDTIYACEETKAFWIPASRIDWKISQGQFKVTPSGSLRYVRADEFQRLESPRVDIDVGMKFKRSNEQYLRYANNVNGSVLVSADDNSKAVMRIDFDLLPSDPRPPGFGYIGYVTHFPYDAFISWKGAGRIVVVDDLVQSADSSLSQAEARNVAYVQSCEGCPGESVVDFFNFVPDADVMSFTPDGGLTAQGQLPAAKDLQWGYIRDLAKYAQTVKELTAGGFHMPGIFLRGDQHSGDTDHGPAIILLTGVGPALDYLERPSNVADDPYVRAGLADYAGINFRVGADRAKQAASVLAGVDSGSYDLTGRSKYYARYGGVSGIHEAVRNSFPPSLTLYGYTVNFSNYGLSYLDSQNGEPPTQSTTEGSIVVPPPSGITQEFTELHFNCLGGLTDSRVPENSRPKHLVYWQGDIRPLTLEFRRDLSCICDPGKGFLVMGVSAYVAHLGDDTVFGELGFKSDGNLVTAAAVADGPFCPQEGFGSRLKLPSRITFDGPVKPDRSGHETYTLTPATDLYYNNPDHLSAPPIGFVNLAGTLDAPFFEDLQVHLQTSARNADDLTLNRNAYVHLMGGWTDVVDGNRTNFFTHPATHDAANNGIPAGVALDAYRSPPTESNDYRVRARKTWLDVVDFNLPLQWNPTTRSFKSSTSRSTPLLVLNVEHELKYLSAENAELVFGAQYSGLPQISLANLAFNAVDEATGVADAFVQAGLDPVREAIEQGLGGLNQILSDQSRELFDPILDQLLEPHITALYNNLTNTFAELDNPHDFPGEADEVLNEYFGAAGTISSQLKLIVGEIGDEAGIIKQVDNRLGAVENAIAEVQGVIENVEDATALIQSLVTELAPGQEGAASPNAVTDLLASVRPSLNQILAVLAQIEGGIGGLRSQLRDGVDFASELQWAITDLDDEFNELTDLARQDVSDFLHEIDYGIDSPLREYTPDEVKARIHRKIEDRFYASPIVPAIQQIFRQRLYDADAALREAIDSVFQQFNDIVKDLISQTLAEVDKSINQALGDINDTFGAGQINGYAHINEDALRELRLDGHFQLKVPEDMELNAYLRIRELDSEGTESCTPAAGSATEVTLGATDVDLDWISPNLRASVGTKFTFQPGAEPEDFLLGLAGSIEITGGLEFETFRVEQLGAAMAFGRLENYLAAEALISFNNYSAFGGLFFGRTCTIDPIRLFDPEVAGLIGEPPFTGAYGYVEVWIPISEVYLGVPASCLFRIDAGVGAGVGYFVEGPTFIGKLKAGVSGEALCLVAIRGDVTMIGGKQGDDFRFSGSGRIKGKAGACPFCVKFGKTVTMTYRNGSWDVDY